MSCSPSRAILFYEIAKLIEEKLETSCGLIDCRENDDFLVKGDKFIRFFELFMQQDWIGEGVEYLWSWAEYAAGMITNITLEPRFWKNKHGIVLLPVRYILACNDPVEEELSRKNVEFRQGLSELPSEPHPEFSDIPAEKRPDALYKFAAIIAQTHVQLK